MSQSTQTNALQLDVDRRRVTLGDREVELSPIATQFLDMLMRQAGTLVTREQLIGEIWHGNFLVGDEALNRVVSETRRALGDDARAPRFIQTVPRRGYRLMPIGNVWDTRPDSDTGLRFRGGGATTVVAGLILLLLLVGCYLVLEQMIVLEAVKGR
jgi:DNA-binding winged helix-turn-helix (wHTH) protein